MIASLQAFRDQVLGEPERDPVIGGRDPEDVRPRRRVDDLVAAFEDDADRDAALRCDAPRRVDARSLRRRSRLRAGRLPGGRSQTARAGESPLSSVSIRRLYVVPPTRMPLAFTSRAASRAPFSIARPRYGVREKGALTNTGSELRSSVLCFDEPPQPASSSSDEERQEEAHRPASIARAARGTRRGRCSSRGDLVGRPLRDHAAGVEHDDVVREAPDDREVVLDDDQREALAAQARAGARRRAPPRSAEAPAVGSSTSRTGAPVA